MRGQGAIPFAPAATASEGHRHGHVTPHQPSNKALGRCVEVQVDIETIIVGHGIQFQDDAITTQAARRRGDDCAAIGNLHLAGQRCDLFLAGDAFGKDNAVNVQLANVDIHIRQQRVTPVGHHAKCRHPRDVERWRAQRGDVYAAGEMRQRGPIKPDFRRTGKAALGIAELDIAQDGIAVNRTLNFPDPDVEAIFHFERSNLPRDKIPSGLGIQPHIAAGDHQQQQCHDRPGPDGYAPPHRQNACPIDT